MAANTPSGAVGRDGWFVDAYDGLWWVHERNGRERRGPFSTHPEAVREYERLTTPADESFSGAPISGSEGGRPDAVAVGDSQSREHGPRHGYSSGAWVRLRVWIAKKVIPSGYGVIKEVGWEDIRV
jgi:hypothetical protein